MFRVHSRKEKQRMGEFAIGYLLIEVVLLLVFLLLLLAFAL